MDLVTNQVLELLKDPNLKQSLFQAGIDTDDGGGPDHLRTRIAQELPMWADVAKQTGLRID